MRFRLRFKDRQIDLPPGDFFIGRASVCHLRLDDHLVSRKHAVIRVAADKATLDDAGSRNGVFLNGAVVRAPCELGDGDAIRIGDAEIVVSALASRFQETLDAMEPFRPVEIRQDDTGSLFEHTQKPTSPSSLLLEVADKSLGMGRIDDAQWILGKFVADIDARVAAGQKVTPETVEKTALYGIKLACVTSQTRWIDWVFDVYFSLGRALSAVLIDELHAAIRALRYPVSNALSRYADSMRAAAPDLAPADRFLAQRLEGLVEVAATF